jgi:hypothetical protein
LTTESLERVTGDQVHRAQAGLGRRQQQFGYAAGHAPAD